MKTTILKPEELRERKTWYLVDASEASLGRMAVRVASILMGKHKPTFTPFLDAGDFVVVIQAEKAVLTGKKNDQKEYAHYTGYPGGRRVTSVKEMRQSKPEEIVRLAVKRMLPKTKLGRKMLTKLKVYAGTEHPHRAQNPQVLSLGENQG